MDTHLLQNLRCVIGQLCTSSHQLEIETGRYTRVPPEERICQICWHEPETEEHYISRCSAYYEIRGCFHCLFREGFGPLARVMEYYDQRCLGLYLLEIHRLRETLLRGAHPTKRKTTQGQITDFFRAPSEIVA